MNRKLWAIAFSVVFCCAFVSSCATVPDTIATVNGTQISGEDFQRALNGFLANYGMTEESLYDSMGASEAVEYKNNIIDEMVLQELMMQYAEEHGLNDLSEEDREDVSTRAEDYLSNLRASFESDVAGEGDLEEDEAAAEVQKRYDEYVSRYDYTQESLEEQFSRQVVLDRVYDDVMKNCAVTEQDVRDYYETQVSEQKEEAEGKDLQQAIEDYVSAQEGSVLYIAPEVAEAVRQVKHVLIRIPDEVQSEVTALREEGKDEEADALRQETMAELKSRADAVLQKAQAGVDFDTLIEEYNEDPGVEYNPDGYQVYDGAAFDEAFLSAALALPEVGAVSTEPVESSFGYHILQFAGAPTAGAVPYESVHDVIADQLQMDKQKETWNSAVRTWEQNADISKHEFRAQTQQ